MGSSSIYSRANAHGYILCFNYPVFTVIRMKFWHIAGRIAACYCARYRKWRIINYERYSLILSYIDMCGLVGEHNNLYISVPLQSRSRSSG